MWEWDPDVERYVGDFWRWIEDPPLAIPGSWIDADSEDEDEYEDDYEDEDENEDDYEDEDGNGYKDDDEEEDVYKDLAWNKYWQ